MKSDKKNIVIKFKKTKLLVLISCSLISFIIGYVLVNVPVYTTGLKIIKNICSYAIIVFSLLALSAFLIKFFSPTPACIITDTQIISYASFQTYKLSFKWSELSHFNIITADSYKILAIYVKNPEKLISMQTNPIKKSLLEKGYALFKTPFTIPLHLLNIEEKQLVEILSKYIPQL